MREQIISTNIEEEMKRSYIDYAMSVISSRALPDVRDGLKPVHRRILFAMKQIGVTSDKKPKKCAQTVGEVMGKYHPHGDSSIYDALVRMAQDFSIRYPLIEGQGNFGSIDGDSAAAMRYTESKMSKLSNELLVDINKDTVNFVPTYDSTNEEPEVLPSRFPNLLVNGTAGIAVGMSTNIPPHNLREVIDAIVKIIDDKLVGKDTTIDELINIVKGPDLPTGAIIMDKEGIEKAYKTGRGKFKIKSVTNIEEMERGKKRIVVTEIPYQVNKSKIIKKIAKLVKEDRIKKITDIRDESNRLGIRVVIELKKNANPDVVLNKLFKYTRLKKSFGIIMLSLVKGEPKLLNLKQMLVYYLEHQFEVITRRTQYELDKAEARAHILEGFKIALENIDKIIELIKSADNTQDAQEKLMDSFKLTETQSKAIVEMKLKRLTGLEREKIETEYRELVELIKELKSILNDEKLVYQKIREEILVIREKYGDERRSVIKEAEGKIEIEDLIKEEQCVITMTHQSYIKRIPLKTYKSQNRGGRGIKGMNTKDEDVVEKIFVCSTHDYLLFFTNQGKVYRLKGYEVPVSTRTARGNAIINLLKLDKDERITTVIPIEKYEEDKYLVMATKRGLIKKSSLMDYENVRNGGIIAIGLNEGDSLIKVEMTDGKKEILLGTKKAKGIRFDEEEVRSVGRTAKGVKGIDLDEDDEVKGMVIIEEDKKLLVVTEKGLGKQTEIDNFRVQKRAGKGAKIHNLTKRTGNIVGIKIVDNKDEMIMINSEGVVIRIRVKDISKTSRVAQGVKLINLGAGEKVVGIEKIVNQEDEIEE